MRPDAVTPELHEAVLKRDGMCFLARMSPAHVCRNRHRRIHAVTDVRQLTVDHVHLDGGHMGQRAPSDLRHLIAMCHEGNIASPSREVREAQREYLRGLYGTAV